MRLASEVSPDKLRGGFYSPPALVAACLDRIADLTGGDPLAILEPSAGDGAFLRGLGRHRLGPRVTSVTAVEVIDAEAAACERAAAGQPFETMIHRQSFLDSERPIGRRFDAAVGNPPFVRFQFVDEQARAGADVVARHLGISLGGVSNLWIPILLKALDCLRDGGAFAFIVPAECLTGISASIVRSWVLGHTHRLRLDLFPPGSFPDVLQEVIVLSGLRGSGTQSELEVVEHGASGWRHRVDPAEPTWTRYLLRPGQLDAYAEVSALPACTRLGEITRLSVATVTGANEYFTVDQATIDGYGLAPWCRPLLPRVRRAPGLVLTMADHEHNRVTGVRSSIVDFGAAGPDPTAVDGPRRYLERGAKLGLPDRYKCRIRTPWYRVPIVAPGSLLLSKRSHRYPRLIRNAAGVVTTDTIYQGTPHRGHDGTVEALVASFHCSLTLLSAEIEGRSFGGGVLELVPSEVARLRVLPTEAVGRDLTALDAIARSTSAERDELLVEETDRRLAKAVPGLTDSLVASLADARADLLRRRLDRNA